MIRNFKMKNLEISKDCSNGCAIGYPKEIPPEASRPC
jgi:hypothetical protein